MAKAEGTRDQCRHCGEPLLYWHCDEKTERWGQMVYRSEKPRWWHTNVDPERSVMDSIYQDSKKGPLGAYCKIKPLAQWESIEEYQNVRGQLGEPVNYCVVLKGEWPQQFCMNPVQDTDLFMCGVHAKKERERRLANEQRRERTEAAEAHTDGGEEVCKRILENWGLNVSIAGYRFDGYVKVQHEDLETLLQSLEEEYQLLQQRRKRASNKSKSNAA
jgi:hypothetical protein